MRHKSWNDFNLCDTCEEHYIVHKCQGRTLQKPKVKKCKYRKPIKKGDIEIQTQMPLTEYVEGAGH